MRAVPGVKGAVMGAVRGVKGAVSDVLEDAALCELLLRYVLLNVFIVYIMQYVRLDHVTAGCNGMSSCEVPSNHTIPLVYM